MLIVLSFTVDELIVMKDALMLLLQSTPAESREPVQKILDAVTERLAICLR